MENNNGKFFFYSGKCSFLFKEKFGDGIYFFLVFEKSKSIFFSGWCARPLFSGFKNYKRTNWSSASPFSLFLLWNRSSSNAQKHLPLFLFSYLLCWNRFRQKGTKEDTAWTIFIITLKCPTFLLVRSSLLVVYSSLLLLYF